LEPAEIALSPDLKELERAMQFIEDHGGRLGLSKRQRLHLQLACEEWFINVVRHGFGENAADRAEKPHIRISAFPARPGEIALRLVDNGPAFNPLEYPDPDLNLPAGERPIGGLGIYLIKKLADSIEYRRHEGQNQLTLRMKLTGGNENGEGNRWN